MSNAARAAIGVVAIAVVVVLFVVLQDSGSDDDSDATTVATTTTRTTAEQGGSNGQSEQTPKPQEPEVPTIVIKDGQPVGGVQELEFTEGEDIRFVVDSDVSEEVHLHGYDVAEGVEAGGEAEFDVPASITGRFEVELEHSVVQIAEITVNPS